MPVLGFHFLDAGPVIGYFGKISVTEGAPRQRLVKTGLNQSKLQWNYSVLRCRQPRNSRVTGLEQPEIPPLLQRGLGWR